MLGGVEVTGAEGPLALGPTARVLLAALLVARHEVVGLDSLTEALWGDDPPATARATLQTHLSKLRRVVQEVPGASLAAALPRLRARRRPDHRSTPTASRTWWPPGGPSPRPTPTAPPTSSAQALGCWHGEAAGRVRRRALGPARGRPPHRAAPGHRPRSGSSCSSTPADHAELVPELEALVGANPLRERLWGQLMLALHRSGRQAEALRSAQELRRHLGEQLGLEPSAAPPAARGGDRRRRPGAAAAGPAVTTEPVRSRPARPRAVPDRRDPTRRPRPTTSTACSAPSARPRC